MYIVAGLLAIVLVTVIILVARIGARDEDGEDDER